MCLITCLDDTSGVCWLSVLKKRSAGLFGAYLPVCILARRAWITCVVADAVEGRMCADYIMTAHWVFGRQLNGAELHVWPKSEA